MSTPHDPLAFESFPVDIPDQTFAVYDLIRTREIRQLSSVLNLPPDSDHASWLLDPAIDPATRANRQTSALSDDDVKTLDRNYRFAGIDTTDVYRALPSREVEKPIPSYARVSDKTYTVVEYPLTRGQVAARLKQAVAQGLLEVHKPRPSSIRYRTPQFASLVQVVSDRAAAIRDEIHDRIISFYATQHYLHVDPEGITRRSRVGRETVYDVTVRVPPAAYAPDPDPDTPNTEEVNQ